MVVSLPPPPAHLIVSPKVQYHNFSTYTCPQFLESVAPTHDTLLHCLVPATAVCCRHLPSCIALAAVYRRYFPTSLFRHRQVFNFPRYLHYLFCFSKSLLFSILQIFSQPTSQPMLATKMFPTNFPRSFADNCCHQTLSLIYQVPDVVLSQD